jgi:hypothetical protein
MNDRHDLRLNTAARAGVVLTTAMLLAACSVVRNAAPAYREPPQGAPVAKLRVVNLHPYAYYADIAVFDSASCFATANLGMTGGNSRDAERIGMLDDKPVSPSTLERAVRADEPLVIGPRAVFPTVTNVELMHALIPTTQNDVRARQAGVCKVPAFVPKAGEQYEVQVDLTPGRCTVTPYHLAGSDGAVTREPVATQDSRISTYEFDLKCFR